VKHAGQGALDQVEALLAELRTLGLTEKSRGVFYRRSQAFLHFHEDPKGLFADLRAAEGNDFDRFRVEEPAEREAFLSVARDRAAQAPAVRQAVRS